MVFCVTKQQCQDVVSQLCRQRLSARALNSDLEQRERDEVLTLFANRSLSVLVATDVAARGLDIDSLDMVINAELSHDPQTHIHRVGRTGRAGEKGLAINLVAPRESRRAMAIEELQGEKLNWHPVSSLKPRAGDTMLPPTVTLCIGAGRKDKLRPGDILGALTGDAGIPGNQVGKITVTDYQAYVAIERDSADLALQRLLDGKIKGKNRRVKKL